MSSEDEPLWYKDAVIYELHVRSFSDSDGDGVGDFRGLTAKLDYLRDLGVTALWLLPFYPSPLRDDGYDISDYRSVNPTYGTLEDLQQFIEEAHRRDLRVITELVLNHTSDRHPWFEKSRRGAPGSPWRDFYVWSATPDRYKDARIIFKDFEHSNWSWDPAAKSYYWHRFYSHQPDLNFENPEVRKAMIEAVDYWLELGVDGLRLDAVPYLFEREGTSCENLPETHAFLKELRAHVDARHSGKMLLAEANQWPEDAVAYFGGGRGDECHTAFHFPVMPRMFMALQTEDRFPIVDILEQTPPTPETAQWMLFLRNHDELTLEMVTDEERDYMYRMYADDPQARINLGIRRRLAPLLGNNRRKIELMNGLLFSMPGTPVIYYGDEIGMGDNFYLGDRNGVRTPMQWSSDRNAGFSPANAQKLFLPIIIDPEYHYEAINVEVQQNNPQSLLWWMRRFIAVRQRSKVFGRGSFEVLPSENRKVLSFARRHGEECLLVVANLSRFVQHVELDLSKFAGRVPVEMLGGNEFPAINDKPHSLTLGPHGFYWFMLEPARAPRSTAEPPPPRLAAREFWGESLQGRSRAALEDALLAHLRRWRWCDAKSRSVRLGGVYTLSPTELIARLIVEPVSGESASFLIPLAFVTGERAAQLRRSQPGAVIADIAVGEGEGLICDGAAERGFCERLLRAAVVGERIAGPVGELSFKADGLEEIGGAFDASGAFRRDASASIALGTARIRFHRRVEPGVSPALELGRLLAAKGFPHTPPLRGAVEQLLPRAPEPATVASIHSGSPNERPAWDYTLDVLRSYFERAAVAGSPPQVPGESILKLASAEIPPAVNEMIGPYLREAELIGRRTAELHMALCSESTDPRLAPEPFSWHYQRSLYQTLRTLTREVGALLRRELRVLPEEARAEAQRILSLEENAIRRLRAIHERRITTPRIRCHGDLHLGRLLYTGKDFLIGGFEGDLNRSLTDRRAKRSPLRDVAGMMRSFHYAAFSALLDRDVSGLPSGARLGLESWARYWRNWVCAAFLRAYLARAQGQPFIGAPDELELLLSVFLCEKAVRELGYELASRPERALIPLRGLSELIESIGPAT